MNFFTKILAVPVALTLSGCMGSLPEVERPNEVGGISREQYREAYSSGDKQQVASLENTIHVRVMADWRFDQLALRAGQTIPVGSGQSRMLITCLPDGYIMVAPATVQGVNVPTMAGIYLAKTGYHCDNGGEKILSGLQSGEHFARLVTQGLFSLVNTGIAVSGASGGGGNSNQIIIENSSGSQAISEITGTFGSPGGV